MSVLFLLEERPAHGYVLIERLVAVGHAEVTGGTLYPLLGRMSDRAWIEHTWEHAESGPGRKVFHITPLGVEHLTELVAEWEHVRAAVDSFVRTRNRGE